MKHARTDYDERIQDSAGIIPVDEPVFLLRGQDPIAAYAVGAWADEAEKAGAAPETIARVRRWASEMAEYALRANHGVPDTPGEVRKP